MMHILKACYDLIENTFFGQTFETGQVLPKTVLLLKMGRIELN